MSLSLGDIAGNDTRFLTDPQGALQYARDNVFGGSSPPDQSASQTYAALTREQWSNYVNTFVPIENQLIAYATDKTQPAQAMQQAGQDVTSAYGAQAGATARKLAGLGINLNQDEQTASARSLGLEAGLANVQAQNTARDLTMQRQESILGNPAPGINAATMPQGSDMQGYGIGASLATLGQSKQRDAMQELGVAANEEQQRNAQNTMLQAQARAGNEQLGGTVGGLAGGALAGAEWGSAAGPWGTLIGGLVGALAGRFM